MKVIVYTPAQAQEIVEILQNVLPTYNGKRTKTYEALYKENKRMKQLIASYKGGDFK